MIVLPSTSKLTATATNNVLTCNWDAMVFPSQYDPVVFQAALAQGCWAAQDLWLPWTWKSCRLRLDFPMGFFVLLGDLHRSTIYFPFHLSTYQTWFPTKKTWAKCRSYGISPLALQIAGVSWTVEPLRLWIFCVLFFFVTATTTHVQIEKQNYSQSIDHDMFYS